MTGRTAGGEAYRVDIGSAHQAQLDGLAFEGATKRNRPILKVSGMSCMLIHIYVKFF